MAHQVVCQLQVRECVRFAVLLLAVHHGGHERGAPGVGDVVAGQADAAEVGVVEHGLGQRDDAIVLEAVVVQLQGCHRLVLLEGLRDAGATWRRPREAE